MLPPQNSSKSTAYIVASCLIHGALFFFVIYYAADVMKLDQTGSADVVEFEMEASLGEQTEVAEWAPEEVNPVEAEPQAEIAPPPPAPPEPPKAPEKKPAPQVAAKPAPKPPAPKPVAKVQETSPVAVEPESTQSFEDIVANEVPEDIPVENLGKEEAPAPLPMAQGLRPTNEDFEEESFEDETSAEQKLFDAKLDEREQDEPVTPKWVPSENFSAQPQKASESSRRTSIQAPGVPSGVRDYRSLSQRPGNVIPSYDQEDRLKRREGVVSFLAYVSPDGALSDFRMKRSSGHRTLDYKSLQAVKKWRFVAGQEGWVEIPIEWTLKGEPIEIGSPLRAGVSRN